MLNNLTSFQTRPSRIVDYGGVQINSGENERPSHSSLGQSFGNTTKGWGGSIWNSSSLGSGFGSAARESSRSRGKCEIAHLQSKTDRRAFQRVVHILIHLRIRLRERLGRGLLWPRPNPIPGTFNVHRGAQRTLAPLPFHMLEVLEYHQLDSVPLLNRSLLSHMLTHFKLQPLTLPCLVTPL